MALIFTGCLKAMGSNTYFEPYFTQVKMYCPHELKQNDALYASVKRTGHLTLHLTINQDKHRVFFDIHFCPCRLEYRVVIGGSNTGTAAGRRLTR
jgi:hypothetical protein